MSFGTDSAFAKAINSLSKGAAKAAVVFALTACFCAGAFSKPKALAEEPAGVDVIIVIDNSGSMRKTDEFRYAETAAHFLLEQFDKNTTRYGVVVFGGEINKVLPLKSLATDADRAQLKSEIVSNYTRRDAKTDTVRAIGRALQELEAARGANRQTIVLLTDGDEDPARDMAELDKEREYVVSRCKELDIPIYTIGLNVDGSISQKYLDKLAEESKATNALSFELNNADQARGIILDIYKDFAEVIGGAGEAGTFARGPQTFEITVPDPYAQNVNFNVISDSAVTILGVADPQGTEALGNPNKIYVGQTQSRYMTVQLIQPKPGVWKITLQGEEGLRYQLDYVYMYTLEASAKAVNAGGGAVLSENDALLECRLLNNGAVVSDASLFSNVKNVRFEVSCANGGKTFAGALSGDAYVADVGGLPAGDYEASAFVEHEYFSRETRVPVTFTINPASASPPPSAKARASTPPGDGEGDGGGFPWLLIAIIAGGVLLLGGGAFAAKKLLSGHGPKGKAPIKGDLSIDISDTEGNSKSLSTGSYFFSQDISDVRLSDVFGYFKLIFETGCSFEERCSKVILAGRQNAVLVGTSAPKSISVYSSEGNTDGYPSISETGRGYAQVKFDIVTITISIS